MTIAGFPSGALSLAVGTVLALGGLAFVLAPLIHDGSDAATKTKPRGRTAPAQEATDGAIAALREIEFDRETGKLSDRDYLDLKSHHTRAALDELRAADQARASAAAPVVAALDLAEEAINRARAKLKSCRDCGPRVEPDARYCSDCGRFLPGACGHCGSPVDAPASAFCAACGEDLLQTGPQLRS